MNGWRREGITGPVKVEYGRLAWLQLDIAFPPPPRHRSTADGIDVRGRVRVVLKRWVRSQDGALYGLLHQVEFRDGAGPAALSLPSC